MACDQDYKGILQSEVCFREYPLTTS